MKYSSDIDTLKNFSTWLKKKTHDSEYIQGIR